MEIATGIKMSKFAALRFGHPSERANFAHTTPFEPLAYRFDETGWTQMPDLAVPRFGHRFARLFVQCHSFICYDKIARLHEAFRVILSIRQINSVL